MEKYQIYFNNVLDSLVQYQYNPRSFIFSSLDISPKRTLILSTRCFPNPGPKGEAGILCQPWHISLAGVSRLQYHVFVARTTHNDSSSRFGVVSGPDILRVASRWSLALKDGRNLRGSGFGRHDDLGYWGYSGGKRYIEMKSFTLILR